MYALDRAESLWILTGYNLDQETAERILTVMEARGIRLSSESLRKWRDHLTA